MKKLLIIIFLFITELSLSQDILFDQVKWKENPSDNICRNYRGCIDLKIVYSQVEGKTKREVRRILGKPDFKYRDNNGILYYSYYINKMSKIQLSKEIKPTISFLIINKIVFDVTRLNAGG